MTDEDIGDDRSLENDAAPELPFVYTLALGSLVIGALFYGALAVLMGPLFGGLSKLISLDGKGSPEDIQVAIGMEWIALAVCGGAALLNAVGAYGLQKRTKWGWVVALVLAVIYVPSACFPFGLALLLTVLNADVRKVCGV